MSVEIGGDIMVHLKKLTNLDCFAFGSYRVKIEIFKKVEDKKTKRVKDIVLAPYYIPAKPFDDAKISKLRGAFIEETNSQYVSQTVMFRSCTEQVY